MTNVPIINPVTLGILPQFGHLPDVQPFTTRSAVSYADLLEAVAAYLRDTLVPSVNSGFTDVQASWEANTTQILNGISDLNVSNDAAIAAAVAQIVSGANTTLNDGEILGALNAPGSTSFAKINNLYGREINVRAFGATGDGTTDDTTAIDAAFTAAAGSSGGGVNGVYFPPGIYKYNGSGYSGGRPWIRGAGQRKSQILLGASSYLINYDQNPSATWLSDIRVDGGIGVIHYTNTSQSNGEYHTVRDCTFFDYTSAAIMSQSSDMPNWTIEHNIFQGANETTTMGIALGDLHNGTVIRHNEFRRNRVHVKLRNGQDVYMTENAFMGWSSAPTTPRIAVWLVPYSSPFNAHTGFRCIGNKFGNENIAAGDFKILIADELGGADNGAAWPNLAANSTGFVRSAKFDNMCYGSDPAPIPYIYSTTQEVLRNLITYDDGFTTPPTYFLKYRTAPATEQGNVYKRFSTQNTVPFSNATSPVSIA